MQSDGGQRHTQHYCAELVRRLQLGLAASASACGPGVPVPTLVSLAERTAVSVARDDYYITVAPFLLISLSTALESCRLVSLVRQMTTDSSIAEIEGSASTWRCSTPNFLLSCEARPIQAPTAAAAGLHLGNGASADESPSALRHSFAPSWTRTRRRWKNSFCRLPLAQRNLKRMKHLQRKSGGRRWRRRPQENQRQFRARCIVPRNI